MTDHVGRFINGLAIVVLVVFGLALLNLLFVIAPRAGIAVIIILVVSYIVGSLAEWVDI